jgi:hypothetical protein
MDEATPRAAIKSIINIIQYIQDIYPSIHTAQTQKYTSTENTSEISFKAHKTNDYKTQGKTCET